MSNGLLYLAGLVALALAALFAVPYFIDWNGYRGVFEEEATRILGREVRVGGNVNVRLLPSPYVSFEKLRIADPTGSTGEPFFRADSFTMRLSTPPLLKGVIEANEIVLEKPFVHLAVDGEGGGNWRSFTIAAGALPFVPAGVTLQSVKINDGTISLHGPKGIGFAQIDGLNGELKADSIDGPYSFKGMAKWADGDREVRIATGAAEPDGSIRFKATVRGAAGDANVYTADGRLADLKGHPRIDGEITAKLMLPADAVPPAASATAPRATKADVPLIDFKARVAGDARGLRVDDIALAFQNVGQPQLIAGSATATWADTLNIDLSLSSRWLDLDRVVKSQAAGDPIATARNFIVAMMEGLPKGANSRVAFDLDQATLGGEAVSGIKVQVARSQGTLQLDRLQAGLPGGTRLTLDGTAGAAAVGDGQMFRGDIAVHGTSLARFLDWAAKDKSLAEAVRSEGPFLLQGQLAMTDQAVDLTDAGAEIAGRPISGELHYARKDRPRLAVTLEGSEIDAGQLWPAGVAALKSVLAGSKSAETASKTKFAWIDPATTDLQLRLRTGELVTTHGRLRDVDMDVGIEQGRLALRACKFSTADKLEAELEGSVADSSTSPRGTLHWIIAAPTKDAYASLVQLFDLPDAARREADVLAAFAPMRLAGSVQLGTRLATAADVAVDGRVQDGGRLVLTALLDGGLDGWRVAPADITATVNSSDIAAALVGLGARTDSVPSSGPGEAGEIFLKAVGTPNKGMTATASAKAATLFVGYDGRLTLPETGSRVLDGELRVAARGLGEVMAVAGLGGGNALREAPVGGTFKLTSADLAYVLKPRGLTIGGSKVDGSIALSYPTEGPAIVTGQIEVDTATIPGLLALVLDRKQVAEAPGAEPLTAGKSIWPEHTFDFSALDAIEGKLAVSFGSLVLADNMRIANARAEVELSPGKVAIGKLSGGALGSELGANLVLERAAGGANLKADVALGNMRVRQSPAGADADKVQQASLKLALAGRASTPGALVSAVTGKGELQLGNIAVHAPTPLAVVATAQAVLGGTAGGSGEQLLAALRAQIDASEVEIGPRTIAIDIADGAAKLAPVTLNSDAGTTKVATTVDLASLIVDSAWVVEPRASDAPQTEKQRHGALPSVSVVYTGPLASLWSLEPHITVEPLERELAIRKMELDADQLERLHKADAERARRDEERQRALESDESTSVPQAQVPTDTGSAPSPENAPVSPAGPAAQGGVAVPVVPPSSASAAGIEVPPIPGQEGQTFGAAQVGDPYTPAVASPQDGSITPPAAPSPAQRSRRSQRQVQPNEQVLRNLMNNAN